MDYKKIIPSIYLDGGRCVRYFKDRRKLMPDPVTLAKNYSNYGADSILVFDLSEDDEGHSLNLSVIKKICDAVDIPVIGGGNVRRLEDIKKLIYAGCQRACLNFSKSSNTEITEEVGKRFGRNHIAACVASFDELERNKNIIKNFLSTVILIGCEDEERCVKWVNDNCSRNINPVKMETWLLRDEMSLHDAAAVMRRHGLDGISGGDLNNGYKEFMGFKRQCVGLGVPMNTFEAAISWDELTVNSDGLVPVVVQDYKSGEVLMLAYMNEYAFERTIESGLMNYYSRSRQGQWQKGDTSGHYQYVKALYADCDRDTILAKVLQVGSACHTGSRSCFFNQIMKKEYDDTNPLMALEDEYKVIEDRKLHPKEGSYTNYLFDKGIDKILKKVGEECTEIIIAAKNPDPEELKYEMADWLYHAMVLMVEKGVNWKEITKEISHR